MVSLSGAIGLPGLVSREVRSACLVPTEYSRLLGQAGRGSGRRPKEHASEHLDAATASGVRMSPLAVACIPHLGVVLYT